MRFLASFFLFLLLRNTNLTLEALLVQDNTFFLFSSYIFILSFDWWPPRRVLQILCTNEGVCFVHHVEIGLREENLQDITGSH